MLRFKTLFVLGAGTSAEMHFPIGSELTRKIAGKLRRDSTDPNRLADHDIHAVLIDHVRRTPPGTSPIYDLTDYLKAASQIAQAMPLANSIDSYLDDHKSDPCIQLCGKLAIVKAITDQENSSAVDFDAGGGMLNLNSLASTWYGQFWQFLIRSGVTREDLLQSLFSNVAVITFNYDRSLEHFLVQAIHTYYPQADANEVFKKLTLFHPYGTVGPWLEGAEHQPFSEVVSPDKLLRLAQRIQTYTDKSAHAEELKRVVSEAAEVMVFLGFGYNDANLKLLGPHPNTRSTRQIYGTALGISQPIQSVITDSLRSFLNPAIADRVQGGLPRVALFDGKCSDLFNHFPLQFA
jgi:hypothetical protein